MSEAGCRGRIGLGVVVVAAATLELGWTAAQGEVVPAPAPSCLYVAPGGNDAWSGTLDQPNAASADGPLATLEGARDAIRGIKKQGTLRPGGVTVIVRAGTYTLETPLDLSAEDSGTEQLPITYRAAPGETVRLTAGKPVTQWKPVTDAAVLKRLDPAARQKVLQADLKAQGITDFGDMRSRGFGRATVPAGLELFFADRPMTLARWPNEGRLTIAGTPAGQNGGKFTYDGDRPKQWAPDDDIWVHGYWTQEWADSYERVKLLDADKGEVTTYPPHGVYGYTKDKRFYFLNVLEELDSPGEWYLDRKSGILYFWPPESIDRAEAAVSVGRALVSMNDVSYVTVQGFILEQCRGTAVTVSGGSHNRLVRCTLRNIGNGAVSIGGGKHNGVAGCEIYETGDGGIFLTGGDRQTLTPANLFAEDNHIHHYSRWSRTYRPAISLHGVGNRISHNHIHDAPHCGVLFGGNDHVLEFNEVHDICRETGDVGAFYCGRDWTTRGHVIRYNFFHDIKGPYTHGAMAVYLDDSFCGVTIFGNVFYKASRAAFIGGGRDNTVENNIFVECHPSVHIDARALGWMKAAAEPDGVLQQRLRAVPYNKPPYSTRYPKLPGILDDDPAVPKGNVIVRNVSVGGRWMDIAAQAKPHTTIQDNYIDADPGFVDPANLNFQLRPDSPVHQKLPNFKPIPLHQIGPRGQVGAGEKSHPK